MIEYIPMVIVLAAFIPKAQTSDKKKIDTIFKNINFGLNHEYPTFIEKKKKSHCIEYHYELPLGLMQNDKLERIMTFSLGKVTHIEGNRHMKLKVYFKGDIDPWAYEDIPDTPERKGMWVPIGKDLDGKILWHDFDKIPHMNISGTTRFGKTVLLKVMLTYLTEHYSDSVNFYIIDLKGGLEFFRYEKLRQVVKVASHPWEAEDVLQKVWDRLLNLQEMFKERLITNVVKSNIKERTFVIIDEGGQLTPKKGADKAAKKTLDNCMEKTEELTRVGGGLGLRVIFCTQYPTRDSLPPHVKMNSDAKIAFRLPVGYASEVAIDELGAEELPCPGRCIYKTFDRHTLQTPMIEDAEMWERLRGFEVSEIEREGEGDSGGKGPFEIG